MGLGSELAPDHLVDYTGVGLDDLDDLGRDVFLYVYGNGNAIVTLRVHGNGGIYLRTARLYPAT